MLPSRRHVQVGSAGVTDHGLLTGLSDDDHAQYALLAGRSGGQTLIGGTGAGDDLTLVGTSGALAGSRINMNTPVEFGPYQPTGAAYGFNYSATETFGNFVGGGLNFSGTINFTGTTFIYESFRGAPTITSNATPGFAAYTVLQALPRFEAGSGASHNPLAPLIVNAGPRVNNGFSGSRTASSVAAVNFAPTVSTSLSGATMNVTNMTGITVAPKYTGVSGSFINFGTIRGVHCQVPGVALFGSAAATESMTAYYGLDVDNIGAFGGTAIVAAVHSSIVPNTNQFFLLNTGNAISDFGAGHIYFDDGAGPAYGGTGVSGFDVWQNWNASGYFRTYFQANADSLRWSNPGSDRFLFDNDGGNTTGEYNFNCAKFSMGAQTGGVGNGVGTFVTPTRATGVNGGWADFNLTQGGNLTIDHLMSDVTAWNINALALTIGTGSITGHVSGLTIGMTTANLGGADTFALLQRGRRHTLGVDSHEQLSPAQLTADVNDYQPATLNAMRQVWRLSSDASRNVTGVAVQQDDDTQWIMNIGANNIVIQHQNAGSVAGNRIISPTGADYTIGPNESCALIHDQITDRWRLVWGTGA